ncbi:unnamed protein product [Cylindrotheca closterium]|uniref:Uncharacterized protein n=1 Tax=Cylindrotheca closterium TaxID=2856 RepID=A0AAD2JML6_9STRA|nr:unnamed protein product [Cylindrotheca closterium]
MKTSASNMSAHMDIKSRDREYTQMRMTNSTPLYFATDSRVQNIECVKALVPIANSTIIEQTEEAIDKYTVVQLSRKAFFVIWAVPPKGGGQCPAGFKGRPKFWTAHGLEVETCTGDRSRVVLISSCGFGHQYGIPSRHLLAVERKYNINDFACRRRSDYAFYAYKEGQEAITQSFVELQKREHFGIVVKMLSLLDNISITDRTAIFPTVFPKATCCKSTIDELVDVYLSPTPRCWNYTLSEYPNNNKFYPSSLRTNAYHTVETCSQADYGNSDFGQDVNSDYDEQGDDAALAFNMNQLCLQQPKEQCQKSRAYNFQKCNDIDRNCMNQRDLNFFREQIEAIEKEHFQRKAMAMKNSQKCAFVL